MVEFHKKQPLPGPEGEPAVHDRYRFACAQQQLLAVRMSVGALPVVRERMCILVVRILKPGRDDVFQHLLYVGDKVRLRLVDAYRGGSVLGKDNGEAVV